METIENGFDAIFADTSLRHDFFKAVSEHDVESLGIEDGKLADIIIEFIKNTQEINNEDTVDLSGLISMVMKFWPQFVNTIEFKNNVGEIALAAYEKYNLDILSVLLEHNKKFVTIKVRSDGVDVGDGHVETAAIFIVEIGDEEVDRWRAHYAGWYWDIDTMEWHVERQDDSEEPEDRVVTILEALGYTNVEEYELSQIEPEEPGYHEPDGKGDWAVFMDDEIWGQYKSESRAQETYDAMVDANEFSGRSSGRYITLRHHVEPEDNEFEEEWEEV